MYVEKGRMLSFPLALRIMQEGNYFYRIADPEKALCDQVYTMSPVANAKEIDKAPPIL